MSSVFGTVCQIGLMSRDIDRSMQYFIDAWGMGPWFVLRNIKASMLYNGAPSELEISIAMANCGDLQFEIVAQHDEAPSLYQDALKQTPAIHARVEPDAGDGVRPQLVSRSTRRAPCPAARRGDRQPRRGR